MSDPHTPSADFPTTRLRRLRQHPRLREMVRVTSLDPRHLIQPLFVRSGRRVRQPIESMPGVCQLSVDVLAEEVRAVAAAGVGGVILFGIPPEKDSLGQDSYSDKGIVQQAIREIKSAAPDLLVMTDVCFCEYTDHGHCGVVNESTGRV
ncbi:MAG TPA: porphobilinogen synthase, partial [Pirellulales bacterium]